MTHRTWFDIRLALTVTVLICAGLIGGIVLLMRPGDHVQLMHNVRVLDRLDDYNMRLAVEDSGTHQWNAFVLRFCSTYRPTNEIAAGVTLILLKYREDMIHACADVSEDKFGYILKRDNSGSPIVAMN